MRREIHIKPGYEGLADVLIHALDQAQKGKGAERHARDGQAFEDQMIRGIPEFLNRYLPEGTPPGIGFVLGQALKKMIEAQRLPTTHQRYAEVLGAINYLASTVVRVGASQAQVETAGAHFPMYTPARGGRPAE